LKSILVTGGGGFIGSNLVRSLIEIGHAVRVLDDWSTGSPANLAGLDDDVHIVEGDVRNPYHVARAMAGVDLVYHLAALPSVARSVADPFSSHSVNATGTLIVLAAARDAGASRVVYASSSSVYGDTPTLPKHEEMPISPRSPYAASKVAGESYARAFTYSYGLETVSLRFFNVFGPRQNPRSEYAAVIPRFATSMLASRAPEIFGDGHQSRDFTFVGNAVDACVGAGSSGPEISGEVFNVGCGTRVSLLEIVEMMNSLLGAAQVPIHGPRREGDVQHSQADITKATKLLGYHPAVTVQDGLARTLDWFARSGAEELTTAKGVR
jgi:UDP-glucose 4-epimerase